MTEPLAVSVEEAAELLGIGSTLAWSLVGQHRLPVLRLGRSVRVPVEALRRWSAETALSSLETEDAQPHHPRPGVREEPHGPRRRSATA